jgi:hypothetical protein
MKTGARGLNHRSWAPPCGWERRRPESGEGDRYHAVVELEPLIYICILIKGYPFVVLNPTIGLRSSGSGRVRVKRDRQLWILDCGVYVGYRFGSRSD